jgi:hypothetical protein
MIGFISSLVTHSFNYTQIHGQYSAIADLRIFQFTVAHALGFSVSTSRLLATDLHTETRTPDLYNYYTKDLPIALPVSLHRRKHKVFSSHFTSSQADLLYSAVLLLSVRCPSLRLTWTPLNSLRNCQPLTAWVAPDVFKITPRHELQRKHIFPILLRRSVYWTIAQQRL